LQGNSGWAKMRRQHMLAQADYYRPSAGLALDPKPNWTLDIAPAEEYERAEQVLTEALHSFMNEWIDSGKNASGQEEPPKRSLVYRRNTDGALLHAAAFHAVSRYLQRHPPQLSVFEGNEIGAVFAEETPQRTGPDDPTAEAREEAARLFVHFMDSDARWQIARCHFCKEYFYPKRVQGLYQRGAFCEACRTKNSVDHGRREWRKKVLELAAEAYPKWKAAYGPRQRWVAMQVNGKLKPGEKRISASGRWVTENDANIQAMAQAGSGSSGEDLLLM
jgi:hypothetical protein